MCCVAAPPIHHQSHSVAIAAQNGSKGERGGGCLHGALGRLQYLPSHPLETMLLLLTNALRIPAGWAADSPVTRHRLAASVRLCFFPSSNSVLTLLLQEANLLRGQ